MDEFRTVDLVIHHGGRFVRDPEMRYEGGFVDLKKDMDNDKITAAGIEELADRPDEANAEKVRQLMRMQEEATHEEHAAMEQEEAVGVNDSRRSTSTSKDDSAEDNTYKLGPDARAWDVEDDYMEFLASIDPGLEQFDDQAHEEFHEGEGGEEGEGNEGEQAGEGAQAATQTGKKGVQLVLPELLLLLLQEVKQDLPQILLREMHPKKPLKSLKRAVKHRS
ncbi:hypothetical protein CDL15_Pgr011356 [Punica granatum]|nr:hypothetical protein CDL15_Pgr011356 [Punica granatum]